MVFGFGIGDCRIRFLEVSSADAHFVWGGGFFTDAFVHIIELS